MISFIVLYFHGLTVLQVVQGFGRSKEIPIKGKEGNKIFNNTGVTLLWEKLAVSEYELNSI